MKIMKWIVGIAFLLVVWFVILYVVCGFNSVDEEMEAIKGTYSLIKLILEVL